MVAVYLSYRDAGSGSTFTLDAGWADEAMVGQIYDDLTPSIVRRLHGERRDSRKEVEEDIRKVTRERDNLVKAVAHSGDIEALVSALREKEHRLSALERERAGAPVVQVERTLDLREQLLGDREGGGAGTGGRDHARSGARSRVVGTLCGVPKRFR
jgi:hypothetical protein